MDLKAVKEEILRRLPSIDVYGAHLSLKRAGRRYVARCPFHADNDPSFSVDPESGRFYCFGCQKHGTVFDFVMEMEGLEFSEALKRLAERAGVTLDAGFEPSAADKDTEAVLELYRRVAGSFSYILSASRAAEAPRAYLEKRALHRATVETFGLGYAPRSPGWLHGFLVKHRYSADLLRKTGLFSERYPTRALFTDRIMFPISDRRRGVIAFGGRTMGDGGPKYINSPETPWFHKSETLYGFDVAFETIRKEKTAILVEGYVDVLAMHQAGLTNAVAPLGTAFTQAQAALVRRFADKIVLFFDADQAGLKATTRAALVCESLMFDCYAAEGSPGMDPADILKDSGADALQKILKYPINILEFLLSKARTRPNWNTPEGKAASARELFPYIEAISSGVKKEAALYALADALDIDSRTITEEFHGKRVRHGQQRALDGRNAGYTITSDLYLMLACLVNRGFFSYVRSVIEIDDLEDGSARHLFIALEDAFRREDVSLEGVLDRLEPPSFRNFIAGKSMSEEFRLRPQELVLDAVKRVRQRSLEKRRDSVIRELRHQERSAQRDAEGMKDLLEKKMYYDDELRKLRESGNE